MIGAIVLATEQGLGYMAKSFYDNGVFDLVYVHKHSSRINHYDWFPNRVNSIEELIDKCDTIVGIETFFDWSVIPKARIAGKKTALIPMYECTPSPLPYQPDIILCPSALDLQYFPRGREVVIPVENTWKLRKKARVFVHNAGNGGLGGRNGTKELLDAMRYVKSPIKVILRSQQPIKQIEDSRIEYRIGTFEDIWSEGDVFIFPEKFNGLSLPIQEAFASGMPVMCLNRFPMNKWLPNEILIPVKAYKTERISTTFQSAVPDPILIAKTIDSWYNKDITSLSLLGKKFNEANSWTKLKEVFREVLSQ
jgi:hypothetical protein